MAGGLRLFVHSEQTTDVFNLETESSGVTDEVQPVDFFATVAALPAFATRRGIKQPDLLEEA